MRFPLAALSGAGLRGEAGVSKAKSPSVPPGHSEGSSDTEHGHGLRAPDAHCGLRQRTEK